MSSLYQEDGSSLFYRYNGFTSEIKPVFTKKDVKDISSVNDVTTIKRKIFNDTIQSKRNPVTYFSNDLPYLNYDKTGIEQKYLFENLFQDLVEKHISLSGNINSFNNWIINILPKQIFLNQKIKDGFRFYFDDILFIKPSIPGTNLRVPLFPFHARNNNFSYHFTIIGNSYKENINTGEKTVITYYQKLGSVPCMVGSVLCHLSGYNKNMLKIVYEDNMDPFGYFIREGVEKIIIIKELLQREKPITFFKKDKTSKNNSLPFSGQTALDVSEKVDDENDEGDNMLDEDDSYENFLEENSEEIMLKENLDKKELSEEKPLSTLINLSSTGGLGKGIVNFKNIETIMSIYTTSGIIFYRISSEKTWPSFLFTISGKGLKGAVIEPYPILLIFDIFLQLSDPDNFLYIDDPDKQIYKEIKEFNKKEKSIQKDYYLKNINIDKKKLNQLKSDRDKKRFLILEVFYSILDRFSFSINDSILIKNSIQPSIAKYLTIENPFKYVILKKNNNYITEKRKKSELYNEELEKSFTEKIIDFTEDIFPVSKFQNKAENFIKIVWQHLACLNGIRSFDDRDSWGNKKLKMSYEYLSSVVNNTFKFIIEEKNKNIILDSKKINNILSKKSSSVKITDIESLIEQETDKDNILPSNFKDDNEEEETNNSNYIVKVKLEDIKNKFENSLGSSGFDEKQETVESLKRKNHIASIQNITKLNPDIKKKTRQMNIRYVQPTQLGFICIFDTPSGASCGMMKNLSCTTSVSLNRFLSNYEEEILIPTMKKFINENDWSYNFKEKRVHAVMLNSEIKGYCNIINFEEHIRRMTKTNLKYYDVEIISYPEEKFIQISTIGENMIRPVLTVDEEASNEIDYLRINKVYKKIIQKGEKNLFNLTINDFIEEGAIEYITPGEQSRLVLAQDFNTLTDMVTKRKNNPSLGFFNGYKLKLYREFDPISLFSTQGALMPYQNTCKGARITYQTKMFSQTLGNYHDFFNNRFDTSFKRNEVHRSFTETIFSSPIGFTRNPGGKMLLVAISALGNNGEDGIVASQDSIQNYRIQKYKTFKFILENFNVNSEVNFIKEELVPPELTTSEGKPLHPVKIESYKNISSDGLPKIGSYIKTGYCIISKKKHSSLEGVVNTSEFAKIGENGIIEKVMVTKQKESLNSYTLIVKIKMRICVPLMIGDKLASRYSQKGTIANVRSITGNLTGLPYQSVKNESELYNSSLEESNRSKNDNSDFQKIFLKTMPMIKNGPFKGSTPDIIINPHGQPTRMTAGMLIEMLSAKAALFTGERIDGSAFKTPSIEEIEKWRKVLEQNGCDPDGFEECVHTIDGKEYKTKIFIAPCYYQTLKSVLIDSFQYRKSGDVSLTTKQPTTGRDLGGAMKNGEMEKSALSTWGASSVILDRFKISSDRHFLELCRTCGNQARINYKNNTMICDVCNENDKNIGVADVSYISIVINRILLGLGIQPTFNKTLLNFDGYQDI